MKSLPLWALPNGAGRHRRGAQGLMEFLTGLVEFAGPYLTAIFPVMAIFTRISVLFFMIPGIGELAVSTRIRFSLAFLATWLLVPLILPPLDYSGLSLTAGALLIGKEAMYGAFLGFALRITIFVLQFLGNIVSQALSISQPLGQGITMEPNTTISTLLMMVGVTLLVTMDFHVEAFRVIYRSYEVFPLASTPDFDNLAYMLTQKAMGVFEVAITLSFPFLLLNFVYNLLLGFVNRAMPQLLVSFVGMPAITGVGLVLLALSAGTLLLAWIKYFMTYSNQLLG